MFKCLTLTLLKCFHIPPLKEELSVHFAKILDSGVAWASYIWSVTKLKAIHCIMYKCRQRNLKTSKAYLLLGFLPVLATASYKLSNNINKLKMLK